MHWLQPNLQGVDPGLLGHDEHAWCYPTAAASLLGKLASDGKWASDMDTGAKYPTTQSYVSSSTAPWMDYAWHEYDVLNLGRYMHTNSEGPKTGTTLENGQRGIVDFIKSIDPSKKAIVELHNGRPDISHTYPLLLHIDPKCIPPFDEETTLIKISRINGADGTSLNENPLSLGHTVVSYAAVAGTDENIEIVYDVAMNVKTHDNHDGQSCNSTKLQLPSGQESCIQHTTVQIVKADSDTFPVAAIIGISVGSVAVLGISGYIIYTNRR